MGNTKRIENGSPSEKRSQSVRKEKDFSPNFISYQAQVYLVENNRQVVLNKVLIMFNTKDDPKKCVEVMASKDLAFWKEAVNKEMDLVLSNNTWVLVDLPTGSKPIGCKWVFRRKFNIDGSIQTFKARLVAKGFKQREGIGYFYV